MAAALARWNIGADVEIDGILSGETLGQHVPRVGHQIAVAQHDAFGAPGRAAGVEDAGKLVVSRFRIRDRRGGREQTFIVRQRRRARGRASSA